MVLAFGSSSAMSVFTGMSFLESKPTCNSRVRLSSARRHVGLLKWNWSTNTRHLSSGKKARRQTEAKLGTEQARAWNHYRASSSWNPERHYSWLGDQDCLRNRSTRLFRCEGPRRLGRRSRWTNVKSMVDWRPETGQSLVWRSEEVRRQTWFWSWSAAAIALPALLRVAWNSHRLVMIINISTDDEIWWCELEEKFNILFIAVSLRTVGRNKDEFSVVYSEIEATSDSMVSNEGAEAGAYGMDLWMRIATPHPLCPNLSSLIQ